MKKSKRIIEARSTTVEDCSAWCSFVMSNWNSNKQQSNKTKFVFFFLFLLCARCAISNWIKTNVIKLNETVKGRRNDCVAKYGSSMQIKHTKIRNYFLFSCFIVFQCARVIWYVWAWLPAPSTFLFVFFSLLKNQSNGYN